MKVTDDPGEEQLISPRKGLRKERGAADDPHEIVGVLVEKVGRIGDADEIARWAAWLLSPATSFVTGAVIPVDGGQVIKPT